MMPLIRLLPAILWTLAASAQGSWEEQVDQLIPKLASETIPERYQPQIELQLLAARASRPGAEAERSALAAILASKAGNASVPKAAQVWIVRQLENIGAEESVPALSQLLNGKDVDLSEVARRALEMNRSPHATETLRAALRKGGTAVWQAGLVSSLGERKDAAAVPVITPLLAHRQIESIAAVALAKIGTWEAARALEQFYERNPRVVSLALLTAAEALESKHPAEVRAILVRLVHESNPPPIRAAALSALIRSGGAQGHGDAAAWVREGLLSKDVRLQQVAAPHALLALGPNASQELAGLLSRAAASAKVLILGLVNSSAESAAVTATRDEDVPVRLAAWQALGRIGSHASVPLLLETAAAESGSPEREAARTALSRITGPNDAVAEAIRKTAAAGKPDLRAAAILALAGRNDSNQLPALLQYAREEELKVSAAALTALRQIGGEGQLQELARITLQKDSPDALEALKAVAARSGNRTVAARALLQQPGSKNAREQHALFEVLSVLGGEEAMNVVAQSARSADPELKDSAVRALSNWPEFSAVKLLLEVAADANAKLAQHVLALRGVARLVREAESEPAAPRVAAAVAGLQAARRTDEKKQLLAALAMAPSSEAAAAIRASLADPELKADAASAALALAEKLRRTDRTLARQLAEAARDAEPPEAILRRANAFLNR